MTGRIPAAIEDPRPDEGVCNEVPTAGEWSAWVMRASLPSEHAQRPVLRWPRDVHDLTKIPELTLQKLKAEGDHCRLYAVGRAQFTTIEDVREWVLAHELKRGQLLRPATIPKGTKRPVKKVGAQKVAA